MKRKYVLHPGNITSKRDGQSHYVSAANLADLYSVPMRDCIVDLGDGSHATLCVPGATHLYPRADGDYRLLDGAA
ncbi:hypothetical protein [Pseudomonas phage PPpW-3]|uniref:Uncharacterized protein n=1 Tax=Pseudomonas phage PPpW-3 TaxID=1279082 RepID=V5YSV3_9CAUD|nr:hypothetical protein X916_gp40 [Pseudomonas phage PPpW-3]BAO20640.1 hypothetical protein [Pseudomonas phage PPpW-3]